MQRDIYLNSLENVYSPDSQIPQTCTLSYIPHSILEGLALLLSEKVL